MKILKYFLLLLLLGVVSLSVFILTQSGNFNVQKKITVDAPQQIVFEYLQNLENWQDWTKSTPVQNNVYNIEWENIGNLQIRKEYSHPYDSLSQDILNDKVISNILWKLSPNQNKTDIEFHLKGSLDLKTKINSFFKGTPNQVVSKEIDKNLNALAVFFIKQYKDFDLETLGLQQPENIKYIYLKKQSSVQKLSDDILSNIKSLNDFCSKNNIAVDGEPFLIFNGKITNNSPADFVFALPVKDKVYFNEDDIFQTDSLKSGDFQYFETTLKGYYTHLNSAISETSQAMNKGNVTALADLPFILRLQNSILQSKYPAEWKTQIYIPVKKTMESKKEEESDILYPEN